MLTALELENFKGIGERQRIEFRPLTLLFGPNSAGKSTVLQALQYLHEIIVHGDADVGRTNLGGQVVDLGGFRRLINGHDMNRVMTLRAEFKTSGILDRFQRDPQDFPLPDLEDEMDAAWVEITVRWRATAGQVGPVVDHATLGAGSDREALLWLELTEVGPHDGRLPTMSVRVNMGHPFTRGNTEEATDALSRWEECAWAEDAFLPQGAGYGGGTGAGAGLGDGSGFGDGRALPLFAVERTRYCALPSPDEPIRLVHPEVSGESAHVPEQVRTFLEMVIAGTLAQLAAVLRQSLYIGPLRVIPPRGRLHEGSGRLSSWGDGLAAWDTLLAGDSELVEQTNRWLERLGAGCSVALVDLQPVDAAGAGPVSGSGSGSRSASTSRSRSGSPSAPTLRSRLSSRPLSSVSPLSIRRLLLLTESGALVVPAELGAGISQIIPVIVAMLQENTRLVMVEQPELHVHPALQVGLGDLFIEAVTERRGRRALLVETHSEHLILRVLKRIRQTTENDLPEGVHSFDREQLSVVYIDCVDGEVRIRRLEVDELGEFVDRWPRGFFAERMEELL